MNKKYILIIDDEPSFCDFYKIILTDIFEDYKINLYKTFNNKEAFKIINNNSIDLIISDINRPNGSGIDFVKEIKKTSFEDIPVLICSASGSEEKELMLYREEIFYYLQKPFTMEKFCKQIERIFRVKSNKNINQILIEIGKESPVLDYKESLDLKDKKTLASLSKDIIAMTNIGGGNIIIGMKEKDSGTFIPNGILKEHIKDYEVTKFNNKIKSYLDPIFHIEVKQEIYQRKKIIILTIPKNKVPVLAKKAHQEANLFLGRIYIRNASVESAEIKTSEEMRKFLQQYIKN